MINTQTITRIKKVDYIFLVLILGLLTLRVPFHILFTMHKVHIPAKAEGDILFHYSYLLTALLILLKRKSLSDYHVDFYALLMFIIVPFAMPFVGYLDPYSNRLHRPLMTFWEGTRFEIIVAFCLLVALCIFRPKLEKRSSKEALLWFVIAILVGIFSSILYGGILSLKGDGRFAVHPSFLQTVYPFLTQLGGAVIMEEPLFRGFLWGGLKNLHWNEWWIWLFQSVLFMIGHVYYLGSNNYAFISTLLLGLICGLIAWRSRSIGTSIIVHGLVNSLGYEVTYFTWW